MPSKKSISVVAIVVVLVAAAAAAWFNYTTRAFRVPVVAKTTTVRVPSGGTLTQVLDSLGVNPDVLDTAIIHEALRKLDYTPRSGQYQLDSAWSATQVASHLQNGGQKEARIVLTNARLLSHMAANATRFIEVDSTTLLASLLDPAWLDSIGYRPETVMAIAIPNTYNVYWDASVETIRDRLVTESKRFWDQDNRRVKADSLGLTPLEVYILASIVESESQQAPERPTIAGVYLNRLRIGMKLDADPTVVFAVGDFSLKRVLFSHLEIESPYNTYRNMGLPPGPIAMASISSIDAVLNPEQHDYFFFVTKGDGTGTHYFSHDIQGHNANIARFQRNLAERGIVR